MNYAGSQLLSRSTLATGRSLLLLSVGVVLSVKLEIDISGFKLVGIEFSEAQLNGALIWVVCILVISHIAHWVGDFASLGKWNSSLSSKLAESTWGGGGKMKGRLEFVIQNFEQAIDEKDSLHKKADIDWIKRVLEDLKRNSWWFEKYAVFYVVVWNLLLPVVFSGYAIKLLWNA
jgi:hypothetical protein